MVQRLDRCGVGVLQSQPLSLGLPDAGTGQGAAGGPIAKEIEVTYKTALRVGGVVRRLLYLHRIREQLEGEVEGDDIFDLDDGARPIGAYDIGACDLLGIDGEKYGVITCEKRTN